jgi:hypothetical protein
MTPSKTSENDGQEREYSNSENYDYHKTNIILQATNPLQITLDHQDKTNANGY